ncbi:MAG: hypothetical protein ABSA11_05335 [Candidatus Bathyarchaeia archaeon]|jgi:hypothetical protein
MRTQAALIICLIPLLLTVSITQTNAQTGTHWENTYGGAKDDYGHSAQQTSDGGFIIAGQTNSIGAGGYEVYLIKTDA